MTSALRILLCVALIALPLAPRAFGEIDEVERLFQGDAPPSDRQPFLASEIVDTEQALSGGIPAISSPEAAHYSESLLWNQPTDPQTATSGPGVSGQSGARAFGYHLSAGGARVLPSVWSSSARDLAGR